MERLKMCRICLVKDAPMYVVVNRDMHKMFTKLTNKPFVTEDRRPVLVCCFCCTKLKQCCRLQRKCLQAEKLFAQMLVEGFELNPIINPDLDLKNWLIITPIVHLSIVGEFPMESHAIKEELPAVFERLNKPKEKLLIEERELQKPDVSNVEELPGHYSQSENNVFLTEIKIEVEEEQETDWMPVAEEADLHIQKAKLQNVYTEEQKKKGLQDSKVIRKTQNTINTPKHTTGFKKPLIYTKPRVNNSSSVNNSILVTDKKDTKCRERNKDNVSDDVNTHRRLCVKGKPCNCDICQQTQKYNSKKPIRIHSGIKHYKCDVCQYSCNRKCYLTKHIRKHINVKPYKCELCQYSCKYKCNLARHMLTHTGEKPFKCEVCQRSFNQKSTLADHRRMHTGEKPYKCDLCQYSCIQKSALKKHSLIHAKRKPYKCEVCQYSCNYKVNLAKHVRKHTSEKLFECDVCQRSFYKKSFLTAHIRLHFAENRFKCDTCQKGFIHKRSLDNHMRIHTGEKPFVCELCQRSFSQKTNLTRHTLTHTGEKLYKCEVCQYSCNMKYYLKRHICDTDKSNN